MPSETEGALGNYAAIPKLAHPAPRIDYLITREPFGHTLNQATKLSETSCEIS